MIKNERQYLITKAQMEKFARALAEGEAPMSGDPLLRKLEADAIRSQLEELGQQIEEYESLRSGRCGVIQADSLEELPSALVKARIAARLSQKELSERLNLKEQQIQRYEATNYRSASLARLQVAKALGVEVHASLLLGAGDSGSAA
ncbi:MAG TPA: helix-turn-helix transcriptional regulator [Pirellulales bacterium]|jgi:hypothetical protein|nr:helix-turn-helix transcriptional regulator [Pirellulales bacterium]